MEWGQKSRGEERSEYGDPDQGRGFCSIPRRMKEFLFAIIVTVLGTFAVKGIEMGTQVVVARNLVGNLMSTRSAYTG